MRQVVVIQCRAEADRRPAAVVCSFGGIPIGLRLTWLASRLLATVLASTTDIHFLPSDWIDVYVEAIFVAKIFHALRCALAWNET